MLVDLRSGQGKLVNSLLQLRLEKEEAIEKRIREIKRHAIDGRTVPLIILDHCDKLIRYEYRKLIHYIEKKIMN